MAENAKTQKQEMITVKFEAPASLLSIVVVVSKGLGIPIADAMYMALGMGLGILQAQLGDPKLASELGALAMRARFEDAEMSTEQMEAMRRAFGEEARDKILREMGFADVADRLKALKDRMQWRAWCRSASATIAM